MLAALRSLAAVLVGLFTALVLVVLVELFSAVVHPVPEGFAGTMEETCQHVQRYPAWVLAVAIPMWAATAMASAWTAQRIGGLYSAGIVGLLLLSALIFNISMLPYPLWFKIASLLVIPIALVAGSRWSVRRKMAGAGETH